MRYLALLAVFIIFSCVDRTPPPKAEKANVKDFPVLTHGKVVDLTPHVQAGKVTVFDFYADWCPPCKKLDRSLVDMKGVYGDKLAVYKLDVVEWGSELTKHHNIKDLPYLIVYNADKEEIAAGPSNKVLPTLMKELNK